MVFKRPYAFLIKHFKLIHLVFFGIILFISYGFSRIVNIFSAYVKYNNLSGNVSSVVSFFLIIFILTSVIFSILMWRLMAQKEKPYRYYLFASIYYIILLIATFYALNIISDLEDITLTQKVSRAYRDVYEILLVPNFYFLIISFIRGIGFDVKRFNFGKDLDELEISSNDNEEVEFVLGNDTYKFKRRYRRFIRELKYYFLENKLFITIIGGSILAIILLILLINYAFFRKVYNVGNKMKTETFTYILNNAYVSSYDYSGKVIKQDKKYLILDFSIKSNYSKTAMRPEYLYLKMNNKVINFKTSLSDSFSDLGQSYTNGKIDTEFENYLFIYELDSNYKGNTFNLNVFDKIEYKTDEEEYGFKRYHIKAQNLDKKYNSKEIDQGSTIYLDQELYGNTSITIMGIEVKPTFEYQYTICDESNSCYLSDNIELPGNSIKNNLISISYELKIDEKSRISSSIKNENNFFDRFFKIEYISNGKIYRDSIATHQNSLTDNRLFADMSKQIMSSDSVYAVIATRTNNYTIKIK